MAPSQSGDSQTTATDQTGVRQFLERYVHQLKTQGAIRSAALERAFHTVERHRLLQTFCRPPGPGRPTNPPRP